MCHASRRAQRHVESLSFLPGPDWLEQYEHYRRSARHDRGAHRKCFFMPHHHHDADRFEGRSAFGVRRPLRFLAHKLDLDEKQVAALVRILDDVKTERAQADVDDRRSLAEFADAVAGEAFDASKAAKAGERRVQSAARLRETLTRALEEIHAMLKPEQRERLAYLIRSGVLSM
jgi:Spy/CpxP family protein refolding chaperone